MFTDQERELMEELTSGFHDSLKPEVRARRQALYEPILAKMQQPNYLERIAVALERIDRYGIRTFSGD